MSVADTVDRELAEFTIASVGERSDAAVRLGMLLSIAVSIEPALLRAVRYRLAPELDAGAESDFWFSELVGARSATSLTLDRDVVVLLREQLRDSGLLDEARSVIAETHMYAPATIQAEEEIIWRTLRDADGDTEAVEALLRRAVKTMVDAPSRAHEIARWADRALQGLPESARDPESARLLAAGSYLRIGSHARLALRHDRMQLPKTPQWLVPSVGPYIETIGVRLLDVGLEFVPVGTPDSGTIVVPDDELRLVQLEWDGPNGEEVSIAESRVGSKAPLPVYATSVRLRTMSGNVYRIDAQTDAVENTSPEAPLAESDAPTVVDRYRVAKVLIVGPNSAAKSALFARLTDSSATDAVPTPSSWLAPMDDDGTTRELAFWYVPDEPSWIAALSTEWVAAVIIVDPVDSSQLVDPWVTQVASWLQSSPLQPRVVLAQAGFGDAGRRAFEEHADERRAVLAQSLEHPLRLAFVDVDSRHDTDELRTTLTREVAWNAQLAFDSVDQFEHAEQRWTRTLASSPVASYEVFETVLAESYHGTRNSDEATVLAELIASVRGTLRPLDWPQADVTQRPYRSVARPLFDERVSGLVAKVLENDAQRPFTFIASPTTPDGEVNALVADEFVRLGIGIQHQVSNGRWLVVPAAARIDGSPSESEVRSYQFGSASAGDATALWFKMLLELQERFYALEYVGARYARISAPLDPSPSGMRQSEMSITLDQFEPPTISIWLDPADGRVADSNIAAHIEDALTAALPTGGRVFEEDIVATPVRRLKVKFGVASVDRGRPFSRFASTLRTMLERGRSGSVVLIAESEQSVYEGADLFVAIFSEPFIKTEACMQDLELASADERDGHTVVAPFIWEYPPLDAELLNRFQPFDVIQEAGRKLYELCERGTDHELREALTNYVTLIQQRLDDRDAPFGTPRREAPRVEYEIVPNVTTREQATQLLAVNLMQKLAMVFHVGSLHPSESVEQTAYFRSRARDVQDDLMHARFVSEYIYAQDATRLVQNGEDPFRPTLDEVREQYDADITIALGPMMEVGGVIAILETLRDQARYLPLAQQALERALGMPVDEAIKLASPSVANRMREEPFVAVARDLLSRARQSFLRFPTSMSECQDFATYIERLGGVIQRYAEWAARQYPDDRAFLFGTFPTDVSSVLPSIRIESEKDNRGVSISARDYPFAIQQTSALVVAALRASLAAPGPAKSVK